ncbi:uncharacterized protein L3040_008119 [Drepanopeziza brunnea f. sp. 'multigermtubi']|uniref:uncharacterized protein n=1 Tax=Drepanopeziza brunnea f. sp. 'multigermtubi' TaxID=698441 RepID=UPI0023909118|nr:hypothetical protein L3040_008119 [Drepanopeziza brunnea f. sp. 'multigermtubi']
MIQENIEKFCNVLKKDKKAGKSSDLSSGFRCLGLEIITSTCFGKSVDCFSNEDLHSPMFAEQIDTITAQLEKPNEYPHPIIYRSLIDPQLYKGKPTPSRASLLEEAIALVVAGTDTTGHLQIELKEAWSNLADRPRCEVLEKLPHLRRQ